MYSDSSICSMSPLPKPISESDMLRPTPDACQRSESGPISMTPCIYQAYWLPAPAPVWRKVPAPLLRALPRPIPFAGAPAEGSSALFVDSVRGGGKMLVRYEVFVPQAILTMVPENRQSRFPFRLPTSPITICEVFPEESKCRPFTVLFCNLLCETCPFPVYTKPKIILYRLLSALLRAGRPKRRKSHLDPGWLPGASGYQAVVSSAASGCS